MCSRIAKGGKFFNEDGLIYCLQMNSEEDFEIMTVGYEFHHGAPDINFFSYDLTKLINNETGEFIERFPSIQSPIPQHFITDFPMIAYKSFMSDNSEIVLANIA